MAAQDATEDEEAADEELGDDVDVIAEDDDEAEVEDDENTELVSIFLYSIYGYFFEVICSTWLFCRYGVRSVGSWLVPF